MLLLVGLRACLAGGEPPLAWSSGDGKVALLAVDVLLWVVLLTSKERQGACSMCNRRARLNYVSLCGAKHPQ
jgi:hypothetical protein